ncbi:hypothetical protein B0A48_11467 [Cryoendolithus antarcticus]|uniref:Uncharacterized protein n=1 Tax=Cryoendolithus antarcticus TaxID=1507870 RepID=A0A1V8SWF7_9PEZI|nr:hypothetical protein B0A48_11467 [Cryoendolithus antarcticus]
MPSTILALFLLLVFGTYGDQGTFTLGMLSTCSLFDVLAFTATDEREPVSASQQMTRFAMYSAAEVIILCIPQGMLYFHDWEMLCLCLLALPPLIAFFLLQHGKSMETLSKAGIDTLKVAPAVKVVPVASNELLISLQSAAIDDIADFTRDETRHMVAQHKCQKQASADTLAHERQCFQDFADTVLQRQRRYKHKHACNNTAARVEEFSVVVSDVQGECLRLSAKSINDATRYATLKAASTKQSEDYEVQLQSRTRTCEALRGNLTVSLNSKARLETDFRQKDDSIANLKSELRKSEENNANLTLDFSLALKTEEAKRQSAQSTVVAADTEIYRLRDEYHSTVHHLRSEMAEEKETLRLVREELANLKLKRDVQQLGRESLEKELAASKHEIEEMKKMHAAAWKNAEEVMTSAVSRMEEAKAEASKLRHDMEELKARASVSPPASRKRSLSQPPPAPRTPSLPSPSSDELKAARNSSTGSTEVFPQLQCLDNSLEEAHRDTSEREHEDVLLSTEHETSLDDSYARQASANVSETAADEEQDGFDVNTSITPIDDDESTAVDSPDASIDETSTPQIPTGTKNRRLRRGQGQQGMLNRALKKAAKEAVEVEQALLEASSPSAYSDTQSTGLATPMTITAPTLCGIRITARSHRAGQQITYDSHQMHANYSQPPLQYVGYHTASHTAYAAGPNNTHLSYNQDGRGLPPTPPPQESDHVYGEGFPQHVPTGPWRAFVPLRGQDENGNWLQRGGEMARKREKLLHGSLGKQGH